ncbi:MAG: hypothetical protein LAT81_15750, partial [Oceanicaulis sp.]|nr:hypothetical protein [Oceanicaulis sp.]
ARLRAGAAAAAAAALAGAAAAPPSPDAPPAGAGTGPGGGPDAAGTEAAEAGAGSEASEWAPVRPLDVRLAGERAMTLAVELMLAGQLKQANEAMRLAERVLNSARLLDALPLPPEHDEAARRQREEDSEELSRLIRNLVKAALRGEVGCLPHWATTKEFLADTLYPDQYYRKGRAGIIGHQGPGPIDALEAAERAEAEAEAGKAEADCDGGAGAAEKEDGGAGALLRRL